MELSPESVRTGKMNLGKLNREAFIAEVQKRHVIWNMACKEYSDRNLRKEAWDEITEIFAKNSSEEEKTKMCELLQKKWKNIRDRYCREVYEKEGMQFDGSRKKAPYMFSKQLSFLNDVIGLRQTSSLMKAVSEKVEVEMESASESCTSESFETPEKTRQVKKMRIFESVDTKVSDVFEKNMVETEKRINLEDDEDRLFLLSLVPTLRSIQPKLKLKAKIELMQLLDNYPKIGDDRP